MNINTNPVTWFEIYTLDIERAKAFYEQVFSYTLEIQPTDGSF
jgi:predicted enzyme related to lactoylglutathione lyase